MTESEQVIELLKACDTFRSIALEFAPKRIEGTLQFASANARFQKAQQVCKHEKHSHDGTCMICGLYLDIH